MSEATSAKSIPNLLSQAATPIETWWIWPATLLIVLLTGCGPRLDSDSPPERRDAVDLTIDQRILEHVATGDVDSEVRRHAVRRLTDQSALTRVAVGERNLDVGKLAVERIKDQALLTKVANEAKDWDVREAALEEVPGQRDLARLMVEGSPRYGSIDQRMRCVARMKVGLREPRIKSRFPRLQCESSISFTKPIIYTYIGRGPGGAAGCEKSTSIQRIALRQDGRTISQLAWSADASNCYDAVHEMPADVDCGGLMKQFLHVGAFTQEDLRELSRSLIPEIREGAAAVLADSAVGPTRK